MSETPASDLKERIDTIEEAYELFLAYAAQGRERDDESEAGGVRAFLGKAIGALDGLHGAAIEAAGNASQGAREWASYLEIVKDDAARAKTLLEFAAAQPFLSSELIDNLNATNHVRTLLTDVFLLDSALDANAGA
ncbi:MAG: hypothetical protein HOO19_21420 [Rhodospirillaceae bacterium]|mgnify:FL=1|jgi:hypothetical protein|nr:hypothetical protein [Rhodospirillaceae bacterium]MBT3885850.1 hypothetical protein [Rhodospirillaceae bacterium]MBT4115176.1 hypothetical protein [Rhodospirillaceae bacterium]MBT4721722.1 hypothetical protein [Rhodospirillaceae bacterium]MBT4751902.1 hypothetical protein [Rhodospirillaceae bacterium]